MTFMKIHDAIELCGLYVADCKIRPRLYNKQTKYTLKLKYKRGR